MFPNCWHRTLYAFTLAVATLFTQSANASPPQCTLTAIPAMISAGEASTLIADCSPDATSFKWSGGTCDGTTDSFCTVRPSVTTPYSVVGGNADGASTVASAVVFTGGPYAGIYLWEDPGYYLSVQRLVGDVLIGTIYWVYTENTVQVGTRTIKEADTFDLFHGQIVGSTATMTGTRFFRACALSYSLTFNADSSITVQQKSVSNSPGVNVADVDCAARYPVGPDRTIPRVF